MFLWTLSIVSLIFSTLSLQKRSNSDMEIATISQHIAKRINFPVLRSMTGPFFDPHWNRLPTTRALLQWFHFYLHPLKALGETPEENSKKSAQKRIFQNLLPLACKDACRAQTLPHSSCGNTHAYELRRGKSNKGSPWPPFLGSSKPVVPVCSHAQALKNSNTFKYPALLESE